MYGTPLTGSGFFTRKGFSDTASINGYAVSISQSSTAASSILNFDALAIPVREVEESERHQWREGHSLKWTERQDLCDCEVCYEPSSGAMFVCDGKPPRDCVDIDCRLTVHHRCSDSVVLPCMSAANFSPDRIRAAFLRCFATLLYNYRKHMSPALRAQANGSGGKLFEFNLQAFLRSSSRETSQYLEMLSETQAFNEFILERCVKSPDCPEIALFDQILVAKRNRGRHGLFNKQRMFSLSAILMQ